MICKICKTCARCTKPAEQTFIGIPFCMEHWLFVKVRANCAKERLRAHVGRRAA